MKSKVTIGKHPAHPTFVSFPIAFYTASFVCFAAFQIWSLDHFWFRVGLLANIAGVIGAIIAAIPGFLDWSLAIPSDTEAKRVGFTHGLFNTSAMVLFAINFVVYSANWNLIPVNAWGPIVLTGLGVGCTMVAGLLGFKLVAKYHVGAEDSEMDNFRKSA